MLTLNQIVSQITNLAAAHSQIAESGVGDFAEWQAKERSYPILWVFHESTSVNQMEISFSIRLICADRVIVGEEGDNTEGHEQEVLSDTLLVLLDFLAYFQQNHSQPYNVVTSATIDPFTERLNDRLAGNSVTIQIRQPFDWNKCQIPQTGASIPPSVDGLTLYNFCDPSVVARLTDAQRVCLEAAICEAPEPCADATITVNTSPFGTAPSGGSLNVPVVNGGANAVGSIIAGEVMIANNATFINGTQVTDQEAEIDANIFVTLDGAQSGAWNAGIQTWEVNSSPCAAANLEINGVQQETIASGATFNLIATLDGVAGGSYNAGTNTLSFTSNQGWQPDPNWPVLPSLTAADERFVGTLAVFENSYNVVSVSATNLAASSNWGDGTPATVSNGSPQFHVYDYATIAATVYTFQGRNVKYVTLDITRVGGAITFLSFYNASTINAGGGNNFVDIIMSIPNSTIGSALSGLVASGVKPMSLLQRLRVKAVGANAAAFYQGTLIGMRSLRFLEWPYSTLGQYNNFSNGAGQVDDLGDIDWGTNTSMVSAFALTIAKKHGNLTANSATTALASYIVDAVRLEEFGDITATSATTLANFFGSTLGSPMLTKVGTINAPACTTIASMFFRCAAFTGTSFTSCANITTTNAFSNCPSIYWMEMFGLTRGVSFAGTAMGNYGMDLFANSIGTASGAQTITVTGTPFGALLTALDATALAIRLVMTGKGYTVAN